jgi:hypothetical protein
MPNERGVNTVDVQLGQRAADERMEANAWPE